MESVWNHPKGCKNDQVEAPGHLSINGYCKEMAINGYNGYEMGHYPLITLYKWMINGYCKEEMAINGYNGYGYKYPL